MYNLLTISHAVSDIKFLFSAIEKHAENKDFSRYLV